jgi:hypothetical protein
LEFHFFQVQGRNRALEQIVNVYGKIIKKGRVNLTLPLLLLLFGRSAFCAESGLVTFAVPFWAAKSVSRIGYEAATAADYLLASHIPGYE